jgi:hypothetical protein
VPKRSAVLCLVLVLLALPSVASAAETQRVGLITGDVVTLQDSPGGRQGIEVDLADREGYEAS